jgi:transcriptional regulator with XRE-family HTH domain
MIKNKNELNSVKQKLDEFIIALKKLDDYKGDSDPILIQMKKDSLKSFIDEFEQEIREYEDLKSGKACFINFPDIHRFHEVLIKARIAHQLSQQELAKKIGTTQQQIQRWESGNYETITWSKMLDVINALGINLASDYISIRQPKFLLSADYSNEAITNASEKVRVRQTLLIIGEN